MIPHAIKRSILLVAAVSVLGPGVRADETVRRVEQLARQVTPQVVAWRREFHQNPELSNREERTSRRVAEILRAMGVDEIKTGVAHHGVVALIRGGKEGPTVALRADMDALPIEEQTGLPFASKNQGAMHACGHDAHTAILLGAAKVLVKMRPQLVGTVKLLFQPSEEGPPAGEQGGARLMIAEGALKEPGVSAIFGLHVDPQRPAGTLAWREGALMASVDRFRMTITGTQTHAAMPWKGTDPIVASAHVITALQTIASRRIDARKPVVVSVGIVRAGQAWNIIPQEVHLEGTIRTHDDEVRKRAVEEFRRIVEKTAEAHGCTAEITFDNDVPVVWNNPELVRRMKPTLVRAAGQEHVVEAEPIMAGEDFAFYAKEVPGMFFFLGVGNEQMGAVHPLHSPKFLLDEAALPVGVRAMSLLAMDYLANPGDDERLGVKEQEDGGQENGEDFGNANRR